MFWDVQILAVSELTLNRYQSLSDLYNEENVLDGWDYKLSSQVPGIHWADVFVRGYEWEGVLRDDIKGTQYGGEMLLTSHMSLEFAYDDKKNEFPLGSFRFFRKILVFF